MSVTSSQYIIATITGTIEDVVDGQVIEYAAAAPPEIRSSYPGSCLPWANQEQAFDQTPNQGVVRLDASNGFTFQVIQPNSYYDNLTLIQPRVEVYYNSNTIPKTKVMNLSDINIKHRTLTYPPERTSPFFYERNESSMKTQAEIFAEKSICSK